MIDGLEVCVGNMCLGQIAEVTVPHAYAYGVTGYPPIVPPKATLVFRVEMLDFTEDES